MKLIWDDEVIWRKNRVARETSNYKNTNMPYQIVLTWIPAHLQHFCIFYSDIKKKVVHENGINRIRFFQQQNDKAFDKFSANKSKRDFLYCIVKWKLLVHLPLLVLYSRSVIWSQHFPPLSEQQEADTASTWLPWPPSWEGPQEFVFPIDAAWRDQVPCKNQ